MPSPAHTVRASVTAVVLIAAASSAACSVQNPILSTTGDTLSVGTWGGENAGLVVNDTIAHAHIGCTFGNFDAPVTLDEAGRFNVAGSYVLRAYPVFVGPYHPAQFAGQLEGNRLTLTITVSDTVEKKTVVLGPVTVTFGREPRMQQCPICRTPGEMAARQELRARS
jgi:hypothetical protein